MILVSSHNNISDVKCVILLKNSTPLQPWQDMSIEPITHPADPRRCQSMSPGKGQCFNVHVEGSNHCIVHGGSVGKRKNYILKLFKRRIEDKAQSPDVKSLRDEIGILRLLLETIINSCNSDTELILQVGPIGDLVSKIERTVACCHKLESSMGKLLDKASILQFAGSIITILSEEIDDPDLLNVIATKITGAME